MSKRFSLRSLILCDDVRTEQNGKDILIGVYNGVIVLPKLPTALPRLIIRMEYEIHGDPKHNFHLVVLSPDKKTLFEVSGNHEFPRTDEPGVLAAGFGPAAFQSAGEYELRVGIDSAPRKVSWFRVTEGVVNQLSR